MWEQEWKERLTPRNIVATVNLECRLDLKTIALHARNAEYNPKVSLRFPFIFISLWPGSDVWVNIEDWTRKWLVLEDVRDED
jgi:hypothetical protein